MYSKDAAKTTSAKAAIEMPTMAPIGKGADLDATGAAAVAVVVVAGGAVGAAVAPVYVVVLTGARVSGRKDCPGLNSSVVF
jgi:hypothetical protein